MAPRTDPGDEKYRHRIFRVQLALLDRLRGNGLVWSGAKDGGRSC